MAVTDPDAEANRAIPGVPVANFVCCILALVIVALRIFTRVWIKRAAGWDDVLIVIAMVFGMGYMVPQMLQIYDGGYGRHRKYLNPAQINIVGSSNVAINVLTSNSLCWSRASIIVFLLRIIGSIQRWARLLCFSMGLNLAVMIGTCIMYGIVCIPTRKEWKPQTPGWCMDRHVFDVIVAVFTALNCVVDFMCAIIPFFAMRHVQIDRRTKYGLFAILSCGMLTAGCGIGRAVSIDFSSKDQEWDLVPLTYWQIAEMYGAIIFASLPAFRQLFTHYSKHRNFHRPPTMTSYSDAGNRYANHSRTTKATVPNNVYGVAATENPSVEGHGYGINEVERRTDVYVELDDIESGDARAARRDTEPRHAKGMAFGTVEQLNFPDRGPSYEHLRGH